MIEFEMRDADSGAAGNEDQASERAIDTFAQARSQRRRMPTGRDRLPQSAPAGKEKDSKSRAKRSLSVESGDESADESEEDEESAEDDDEVLQEDFEDG
ncbi:hypothetical protein LTR08_005395 [Meristemomyces frigidus]|nr:hypothetical protein LTR08_005395 [Meristemomyces frigidus]